jgi:hypothetical protein
MRRIVEAIKQCPEQAPCDAEFAAAIIKYTKPLVQDWDVVTSDSLRSPFQGFIRFRTSGHYEETEAAKQSKKLDAKYRQALQGMKWCEEQHGWSCYVTEYRFEFELGSDTPELRKATMFIAIEKEPRHEIAMGEDGTRRQKGHAVFGRREICRCCGGWEDEDLRVIRLELSSLI